MRPEYDEEVRRQMVERMLKGEPVSEVSKETGILPGTLSNWKNQFLSKNEELRIEYANNKRLWREKQRKKEKELFLQNLPADFLNVPLLEKFLYISAHKKEHALRDMCQWLEITYRDYYRWLRDSNRKYSLARTVKNKELLEDHGGNLYTIEWRGTGRREYIRAKSLRAAKTVATHALKRLLPHRSSGSLPIIRLLDTDGNMLAERSTYLDGWRDIVQDPDHIVGKYIPEPDHDTTDMWLSIYDLADGFGIGVSRIEQLLRRVRNMWELSRRQRGGMYNLSVPGREDDGPEYCIDWNRLCAIAAIYHDYKQGRKLYEVWCLKAFRRKKHTYN